MRRYRTIYILIIMTLIVFPLVFSFAGGKKEEEATKKGFVIGVSPKLKGSPYWDAAEQGAINAGKDLGIEVIVLSPTTADATAQYAIIDDLITRGVDALCVGANDETALLPVLERADKEGIIIVTYDSDAPASARKYMIGAADNVAIGRKEAELLVEDMGESGQVAIMVAALGALNIKQNAQGATEVLSKYPNIEIVKTVASGDDQQQAFINAENLLRSFPDLKGIIGAGAGEPPGAAEAVVQAGKAGEIEIVGTITPNSVKQYFHDGVLKHGVLWDPAGLGYTAVKVAHMLLMGEKPKDGDILAPGGNPIKIEGDWIYIGLTVFTPENIDNYDF